MHGSEYNPGTMLRVLYESMTNLQVPSCDNS